MMLRDCDTVCFLYYGDVISRDCMEPIITVHTLFKTDLAC